MITIIRNVHVYSPEDLGVQDVLIVGKQIHAVGGDFDLWAKLPETTEIDGTGKLLVPGFVDSHVHILGGGGAAGFGSRGPETSFSETVLAGTTTVVGVVGVDQEGRDLKTLYAKTKSLEFRGITAKMFTCGFDTEVTITGSIKSDIYLVDNVIGAKCCVSDRRGAQTTYEDLKKAMATSALGGLLSRKAGVLHIHMGDAPAGLMPVIEAQQETAVMIKNVVPTHINRNELLMEQGLIWAKNGGVLDLTPCILSAGLQAGHQDRQGGDRAYQGRGAHRADNHKHRCQRGAHHSWLRAHGPQPHGPHVQGVPGHGQGRGHLHDRLP